MGPARVVAGSELNDQRARKVEGGDRENSQIERINRLHKKRIFFRHLEIKSKHIVLILGMYRASIVSQAS